MTGSDRGVYRRGSVWWIDYTDLRGKRHQERVGRSRQLAVRARAARLAEIEAGKFGLRRTGRRLTLRDFVDRTWRPQVAIGLRPSTRRAYEMMLREHLLPAFGNQALSEISRGDVKAWIAMKAAEQRHAYSRDPNPNRPRRSAKSLRNMTALLSALLECAATEYEMIGYEDRRRRTDRTGYGRGAVLDGCHASVTDDVETKRTDAGERVLSRTARSAANERFGRIGDEHGASGGGRGGGT